MDKSTSSLSWPNMFDVARNQVSTLHGNGAVLHRTRLLFLTEPTEVYMNPDQGVGLKRYLWQYNNPNLKKIILDRLIEQLRLHEPCCIPEETQIADGLLFTGETDPSLLSQEFNQLKMTVAVKTVYGDTLNVDLGGNMYADKLE